VGDVVVGSVVGTSVIKYGAGSVEGSVVGSKAVITTKGVGSIVLTSVGITVRSKVGSDEGPEGTIVGKAVGSEEGEDVGSEEGEVVGLEVGEEDGLEVGEEDGVNVVG
jgi:hypothetical protein